MNWYHRGEERYVEYGSSFQATRAFGVVRSLFDTVYNMNMAHLSRDAQDGVRAPRRRRAADRLHDLPDLPRPHTATSPSRRERLPPASPRRPSSATPCTAPRELFYADLFDSRDDRLHVGARHARAARPAHRLRGRLPGRARPVRLHALLAARQRHHSHKRGPDAQVTSIAEADRALERIMHVAGGAEAFLEEHAVIVMSDHSQTTVEDRRQPRARASPTRACSSRPTRRRRGRARGVAGGALGHGLRARPGRARASWTPRRGDLAAVDGRRPGGDARERGAPVVHGRAASCASPRAAT